MFQDLGEVHMPVYFKKAILNGCRGLVHKRKSKMKNPLLNDHIYDRVQVYQDITYLDQLDSYQQRATF